MDLNQGWFSVENKGTQEQRSKKYAREYDGRCEQFAAQLPEHDWYELFSD